MNQQAVDIYNEWAVAQEKIEALREQQQACIETAANIMQDEKPAVRWAFNTRYKDNKQALEEQAERQETAYSKIFGQ